MHAKREQARKYRAPNVKPKHPFRKNFTHRGRISVKQPARHDKSEYHKHKYKISGFLTGVEPSLRGDLFRAEFDTEKSSWVAAEIFKPSERIAVPDK